MVCGVWLTVPWVPKDIFGDAGSTLIAESGRPGEENLFGVDHGHVHRVGYFASVFPAEKASGHGDGFGDREIERLVPEGKLVAHVFEDVAAGIVPEEAPVEIAVGVEGALKASPRTTSKRYFPASYPGRMGRDHWGLPTGVLRYMRA